MQMDITYTKARDRQCGDISKLLAVSYAAGFSPVYSPGLLHTILPLITKANEALIESGCYYVAANHEEQIIGCGGWSFDNPQTGKAESKVAHIRHFATHPDFTGSGIGRHILGLCEQDMIDQNVRRIECFASLNAVPFYTKCGFVSIRPIDVHITDIITFPTMLMAKQLP